MQNVGRIQLLLLVVGCSLPLFGVEADEESSELDFKVLVGHWDGKARDAIQNVDFPCSFDFWYEGDEMVAYQGSLLGTGRFDRVWIQSGFLMAERLDAVLGRLYAKAKLSSDRILEFEYGIGRETTIGTGRLTWVDTKSQKLVENKVLSGTYNGIGQGSAYTEPVELELQIQASGTSLTGKISTPTTIFQITQGERRHNQIFIECGADDGKRGWIVGTIGNDGSLWIFWRLGQGTGGADMRPQVKKQ